MDYLKQWAKYKDANNKSVPIEIEYLTTSVLLGGAGCSMINKAPQLQNVEYRAKLPVVRVEKSNISSRSYERWQNKLVSGSMGLRLAGNKEI